MKLAIVVVEDDDSSALIKELTQNGYNSTKLASTGGFLLQGNTTLLIGVEDTQVDSLLTIVRTTCTRRKKYIPHASSEIPTGVHIPIEIDVGGAIVFVVEVDSFHRL